MARGEGIVWQPRFPLWEMVEIDDPHTRERIEIAIPRFDQVMAVVELPVPHEAELPKFVDSVSLTKEGNNNDRAQPFR